MTFSQRLQISYQFRVWKYEQEEKNHDFIRLDDTLMLLAYLDANGYLKEKESGDD